jgi:hypothetical protein
LVGFSSESNEDSVTNGGLGLVTFELSLERTASPVVRFATRSGLSTIPSFDATKCESKESQCAKANGRGDARPLDLAGLQMPESSAW